MTLLPTEREIPLGLAGFVLTTHRVRLQAVGGGQHGVTSMMLEHVTRVAATKTQHDALLWLALLLCGLGMLAFIAGRDAAGVGIVMILAGLVFILLYFGTRKTALAVASADGGMILIQTGPMSAANMVHLIDKIEEAKDQRARTLCGAPTSSQTGQGGATRRNGGQGSRARRFYYQANGDALGPVSEAELQALANQGMVTAETFICPEGSQNWRRLDEINEA